MRPLRHFLGLSLLTWSAAALGGGHGDSCAALLANDYLDIPDAPTSITSAAVVADREDLPAHCLVRGYVAPQVNFELRLPVDSWNEKFLMQGCGGLCGRVAGASCDDALARDYAVVVTDMGHSGPSYEALWAYDNLDAEIDFAYRATHVVAVAAKALLADFYGRPHRFAYFRGCSTGGRQGLIEAQRFPKDFDGIIAGAPVLDETGTAALHLIWSGLANLDSDGGPILSPADVDNMAAAVIKLCDENDGFADGIIEDPRNCDWQAAVPRGLAPEKRETLRKLYAGASDSRGRRLVPGGLMPGSEYEWVPNFVGRDGPQVFHPDGPVKQLYQFLLFLDDPGPDHSASEFDFDRDPARMALMEVIYSAKNPDLRNFRDAGGKLILYQGWDDAEVTPMNTIDYFETMRATMGGSEPTAQFARLFMLPGVAHCRRGPGADAVDWLTLLENWVERGDAPDQALAHHLVESQGYMGLPRLRYPLPEDSYDWTRPVFPYPDLARYSGDGPASDAANWQRLSEPAAK